MRRKSIATCCFLVLFSCFCCCEWTSRYWFNQSLENLKIGTSILSDKKRGFSDGRPLATGIPVEELDHYLVGYVWRSIRLEETGKSKPQDLDEFEIPKKKSIVVRWPSLIGYYKVLLPVDFRDRVTEVSVLSSLDND